MSYIPETIIICFHARTDIRQDGSNEHIKAVRVVVINPRSKANIFDFHPLRKDEIPEGVLRCVLEVPNEKFTNVKVASAAYTSNYENLFRVVDENGYSFEMQGSVVLECIANGENDRTVLTSEFVWALDGQKMRPIRVGSKLYNQLMFGAERKKRCKRISNKDLVIGTIYKTIGWQTSVYLGRVKGRGLLFCEVYSHMRDVQNAFDTCSASYHDIKKSHSFVEAVGTVNVTQKRLKEILKNANEKWDRNKQRAEGHAKGIAKERLKMLSLIRDTMNSGHSEEESIRNVFRLYRGAGSWYHREEAQKKIKREYKKHGTLAEIINEELQ
jgi:hypothetical protein